MKYAVIMAGGAGKRLWPLSRQMRPKQILPLLDGQNLLQLAVDRLRGLFDTDKIFIITNKEYGDQIAETLPDIPRENIVGEPEGRDTANAVALAAAILEGKDPEGTMAVFSADHVIRPTGLFQKQVTLACDTAESNENTLITFGIKPSFPHTGFGYIHCSSQHESGLYHVNGFAEKPDRHTARQYVESGDYYWNSGMFVWTVKTIKTALETHLPDSMNKLATITEAVKNKQDYTEKLAEVYPTLEKISIDYAVMEKAPKVMMLNLQCEWLDVGSWPAMDNVIELDESDNAVVAKNAVLLDSMQNVIVSEDDHLIATLGMDDCIIVHSPDATLVCKKSDSQRLKELLEKVEAKFGKKYS